MEETSSPHPALEEFAPGGFPMMVDNSLLSSYKRCPKLFQLQWLQHWASPRTNDHLNYGKAYAAGLEALRVAYYAEGRPIDEAMRRAYIVATLEYGDVEATILRKSYIQMLLALTYYFKEFNPEIDAYRPHVYYGRRMIEFSFATPIGVRHPITGEEILYTGRTDQIVEHETTGEIFVEDDKTASRLGDMWATKWEMASQFTGYVWGARQEGINAIGALVRGVAISEAGEGYSQEVLSYRSEYEVNEWLASTQALLDHIISDFRRGFFSKNLDDGCAAYGGCTFKDICKNKNPEVWLPAGFIRRLWNPATRVETILE